MTKPYTPDIEGTIRFHGHHCPGITYGIRAAEACVDAFGLETATEAMTCIAEKQFCGVDAVQFLLGCTTGKKNMIVHEKDVLAFVFVPKDGERALRVAVRDGFASQHSSDRAAHISAIMDADLDEVFEIRKVDVPEQGR